MRGTHASGLLLTLFSAVVLIGSACSGSVNFSIGGQSPEDAALELIGGELTEELGLGALASDCDEVEDPDVGTVFNCGSRTEAGENIQWEVTVDREDHIDVQSQNIVLAAVLPEVEAEAANVLFEDNPLNVGIDCGDSTLVLDADKVVVCSAATAAAPADEYDVTITFTDLDTGDFTVELAADAAFSGFDLPGQGPEDLAVQLIETDLADSVGLGALIARCDAEPSHEVGTMFNCTSETPDGQTIRWEVTVDREDHVDVTSANLLLGQVLPEYEAAAVQALYGDNPLRVVIDCGEETRVVSSDSTMLCDAWAEPEPDIVYDVLYTLDEDLSTGDFGVEVADQPRP